MNEKLKALNATIEAKSNEVEQLFGKANDMTTEDMTAIRALNAEIETLSAEAKELRDLDAVRAKNSERLEFAKTPATNPLPFTGKTGQGAFEGSRDAGAATIERKSGLVTDEGEMLIGEKVYAAISSTTYKQAFRTYLRKGYNQLTSADLKTLQEGSDTAGGFLVPEDMQDFLLQKKPTPTRVYDFVQKLNTSRDAITIPKVVYNADDIYTTGIRSTWTGENPTSAQQARVTDPVFGTERIPVYTNMMSLPMTNDMVEDAAFALDSWIKEKFQETINLLRDNEVINGPGQNQPTGILVNPGGLNQPAVITSGNANALTPGQLIQLGFSLPEQYDENARFIMNKTNTAAAIGGMVDANGRFLWGNGLQDSGLEASIKQRMLAGYPVAYSGFMPNVGASTYPIIFGDLTGYTWVNRIGFSIQVLREVYAELNQIVLLGRFRAGGQVTEPWKLKIHQCHV